MEKYKGFHQYNVDEQDGKLIIWNKQERINVNELLQDYASVETRQMPNGHIVAVITKSSNNLPSHLQIYVDDTKDKGELCQVLLQFQYNNSSLLRNIRESIYFGMFNAVQCFAQMLPWGLKMRLKRLIKQA